MKYRTLLPLLILIPVIMALRPAPSSDVEDVLNVTHQLFEGIETQDTASLRKIFMDGSQFYASIETKDGQVIQRLSHDSWIKGLVKPNTSLLERSWNPQVKVHKGIAMVWTPYDFYVDGKFSHCGVNAISLVKTTVGWKIADSVFSVEKECDESPLGPLKQ